VLDPYRLEISFIAFINIVCCLKIYLHQTMHMGFVFVLKMFQDECNRDCNRDYFQCNRNRNRLHLCCNCPMSDHNSILYLQRGPQEQLKCVCVSRLLCFKGASTTTVMCRYSALQRLPTATALCKYSAFQGITIATVMCNVPCVQRGPTANAMYKQATFLSKGPPTAVVMCKCLTFKGAKAIIIYMHFSFKETPTSLISRASYFNLGGRSLLWGAKWWWEWILGSCDSLGPSTRGYGVRLIRLCLHSMTGTRVPCLTAAPPRHTQYASGIDSGCYWLYRRTGHLPSSSRWTQQERKAVFQGSPVTREL